MNERDELARQIAATIQPGSYDDAMEIAKLINHHPHDLTNYGVAQAILAAGYRKPWAITTSAERAILQPGTICMDKDGNAWKRGTGSWVSTGGDTGPLYDEDDLELTILHEGTQP